MLHDTVAHYHLRSLKGDAAINAKPTITIVILADKGRILNIIKTTAINANIIPITYRIILSFLFITNRKKVNLNCLYCKVIISTPGGYTTTIGVILWFAIADEVRTRVIDSDKNIVIPELI